MSDIDIMLQTKIATLEGDLEKELPSFKTVLRDIHRMLKNDPDQVTLLTEEECAIIADGLAEATHAQISATALKAPRKKALKDLTVDDL